MYLDGYRIQILALVRQGLSDRAIAELVRVSPSTVRYWRERNGISRPSVGTTHPESKTGKAPETE
jgi:transposase